MDNQAFSKIWIIVISLVLIAGGILAWQYFGVPEEEEVKEAKIISLEIVPSEETEEGIIYQEGAKAVATGENLMNVEFRQQGGGQIYTSPEGGLVGMGTKTETQEGKEQWELLLPSDRLMMTFCALGFDENGEKRGEICLFNVIGEAKKDETADWKSYRNEDRNEEYEYEIKYPQDWKLNILQIYGRVVTFKPSSLQKEFTIVVLNDKKYQTLEDEAILPKKPTVCLAGTCVEPTFLKEKEVKLDDFDGIQRQIAYSGLGGLVEIETYILKDGAIFILELRHWEIDEVKSEDLDFYNQMLSTFRFIK